VLEDLKRIEGKIDGIGNKIDSHLERISILEESVRWLKGHVKFSLTIAISVVGILLTAIIQHLKG
jgi:hypothetical protein